MVRERSKPEGKRLTGFLVGFGFFALAAGMYFQNPDIQIPVALPEAEVTPEQIRPGAWREALGDPPTITTAGFTQRCNDCHTLFEAERDPGRELVQHTHIQLRHGTNDSCLNCHDRTNRERLAVRNGDPVPFADVAQLCAQCHGPVYRDWLKGTHGKRIGAWDPASPNSVKLTCSQCHDPHSPAYAPMTPLPAPNTLRMGDPKSHHHAVARSPLRRWRVEEGDSGHGEDH